jgi:hypothetical protein
MAGAGQSNFRPGVGDREFINYLKSINLNTGNILKMLQQMNKIAEEDRDRRAREDHSLDDHLPKPETKAAGEQAGSNINTDDLANLMNQR